MGNQPTKQIQVTLVNATPDIIQMEGFVKANNYSLVYHVDNGITVAQFLEHVNKYRYQPIHQLYHHQHVYLDTERLYDDLLLYVRP